MKQMLDKIEEKILQRIDADREQIISFAEDIAAHPEPGFEEIRTSQKAAQFLKNLGYEVTEHLVRTGVRGDKKITDGPNLTVIGELDAIGCKSHPMADSVTGVAHACGHHAQMAGVFGAALALTVPEIAEKLDGQVVFFATPAEEYGEIEFKNQLREQGKIRYGGGKCELLRIGAFDDIDLCLTHHIRPGNEILVGSGTGNGFVMTGKEICWKKENWSILSPPSLRRSIIWFPVECPRRSINTL